MGTTGLHGAWWVWPLALVLYGVFRAWYDNWRGPLRTAEIDALIARAEQAPGARHTDLQVLRRFMETDDGKEFVMQNLVRYRPKALYPEGHHFGDDPREADKRYGKSIIGDLLRYGNLVIFIARKTGDFVKPEGADAWHYVAMVRYRSRRDFVRFATRANQAEKFMHKWAAIEKTHVFPVKPIISLVAVRTLVALSLFTIGLLVTRLM